MPVDRSGAEKIFLDSSCRLNVSGKIRNYQNFSLVLSL